MIKLYRWLEIPLLRSYLITVANWDSMDPVIIQTRAPVFKRSTEIGFFHKLDRVFKMLDRVF